ncbi:hypothetical protein GA707_12185 [Nostocoides sp. F2B08]|nr:hypothetical protein GA707_12185 [Tetrasphaera sp. F2B08]
MARQGLTVALRLPSRCRRGARGSWCDELTARELDVLRLLDSDLTGPEVAAHLFVSINTLRTHTRLRRCALCRARRRWARGCGGAVVTTAVSSRRDRADCSRCRTRGVEAGSRRDPPPEAPSSSGDSRRAAPSPRTARRPGRSPSATCCRRDPRR